MKFKHFCLALGLTTIGSAASIFLPFATLPAKALTWNLNNVSFNDGGTAIGSFDYNAASSAYNNINVSITGSLYSGSVNFTSSDNVSGSANSLTVCKGNCSGNPAIFALNFQSPLNNTGGNINLSSSTVYGFPAGPDKFVSTGSVTTTAVPFEFSPSQGMLLGVPFFIGLRILKSKRALRKVLPIQDMSVE